MLGLGYILWRGFRRLQPGQRSFEKCTFNDDVFKQQKYVIGNCGFSKHLAMAGDHCFGKLVLINGHPPEDVATNQEKNVLVGGLLSALVISAPQSVRMTSKTNNRDAPLFLHAVQSHTVPQD